MNNRKTNRKANRKVSRSVCGHLIIEMAMSLPIIISVLALSLNGFCGLLAAGTLDEACIDAARAASLAPDIEAAKVRAAAAVRTHCRLSMEPSVKIVEFNTMDGDCSSGPYLILETTVTYSLPFSVQVFHSNISTPKSMEMKRTYAYPILPVKENEEMPTLNREMLNDAV